jgi:CspA family cold shock protein
MLTGKVKWWSPVKGFGFITSEDVKDTLVHISDVEGSGLKELKTGEVVSFSEIMQDDRKSTFGVIQKEPTSSQINLTGIIEERKFGLNGVTLKRL